jgi:hypothetical protein
MGFKGSLVQIQSSRPFFSSGRSRAKLEHVFQQRELSVTMMMCRDSELLAVKVP